MLADLGVSDDGQGVAHVGQWACPFLSLCYLLVLVVHESNSEVDYVWCNLSPA